MLGADAKKAFERLTLKGKKAFLSWPVKLKAGDRVINVYNAADRTTYCCASFAPVLDSTKKDVSANTLLESLTTTSVTRVPYPRRTLTRFFGSWYY